jgi:hypothetical protein
VDLLGWGRQPICNVFCIVKAEYSKTFLLEYVPSLCGAEDASFGKYYKNFLFGLFLLTKESAVINFAG